MNREIPRLVAAAALGAAVAIGLGAGAANAPRHKALPADTCDAVYELRSDISDLNLRLLDLDDIRNGVRDLGVKMDGVTSDVEAIKLDLSFRR